MKRTTAIVCLSSLLITAGCSDSKSGGGGSGNDEQKASGAVPPWAPVCSVDQYCGQGSSWTSTVMPGFSLVKAAAISFIAGVCVPAQTA